MRLLSPSAWEVHTVNMKQPGDGVKKKKKKHIKYSVLSLQLYQYGGKWMLNILHRPPKWRVCVCVWGGDVRVTTAAVY